MACAAAMALASIAHGGELSFLEPQRVELGGEVLDLVSADFTGNGYEDVCVARKNGGGTQVIELLEQTKLGEFHLVWSWPIATVLKPASIEIIDFDHGGGPDLVVSLAPYVSSLVEGEGIYVFRNVASAFGRDGAMLTNEVVQQTGEKTHFEAPRLLWATGAERIIVVDVNGDGIDDIVPTAGSASLRALILDQSGEATQRILGSTGLPSFHNLQFGDVDGDGDLDVVVRRTGQSGGSGAVLIKTGDAYHSLPLAFLPVLGIGLLPDWTGDGIVDLLSESSEGVSLYVGDATGAFRKGGYSFPWYLKPYQYVDLDRDGNLDIVGRRGVSVGSDTIRELMVLYSDGAGGFDGPHFWWAGPRGNGAAGIDLVGDVRKDLVTGTVSGFSVIRNRGQRRFRAAQILLTPFAWPNTGSITVGDIDGDGHCEIITTMESGSFVDTQFEVYGRESGLFQRVGAFGYETPGVEMISPRSSKLIDADGDGDLDLACNAWGSNFSPNETFLRIDLVENVGGQFESATAQNIFSACPAISVEIAVHDLDGDGRPDLFMPDPGLHYSQCGDEDLQSRLIVFQGENAGIQSKAKSFPFGAGLFGLLSSTSYSGDINGDGFNDVVFDWSTFPQEYPGPQPVMMPGAVDGFGTAVILTDVALRLPRSFVDFNADGIIDIVGRPLQSLVNGPASTAYQFAVQYGVGSGRFGDPELVTEFPYDSPLTQIVSIDLTGDGVCEVVVNTGGLIALGTFIYSTGEQQVDLGETISLSAPFESQVEDVQAEDLDGDGDVELIIVARGGIAIFDSIVADLSPGDIDLNGVVNGADLAQLMMAWGLSESTADLNGDGFVDGNDLAQLLANWNP